MTGTAVTGVPSVIAGWFPAPGCGFLPVTRPTLLQLFAIQRRDSAANVTEAGPGELCGVGLLGMLRRYIQGLTLAVAAPSEIQVGAMAAGWIGVTRASQLAAGARG